MAASTTPAALITAPQQKTSLSPPLRHLTLTRRLSLSSPPRRLIAANSFSGGKKNGRKSAGGNNGGRSGGGNNNGGRSGGGGGGGGDGKNRYPLPVPSYWPSNQLYTDTNLYESFVKHHVDISHALIITLGYMFGFFWIWQLFLYLTGFHDYMEKQKCKEVKEDSNMRVKE